MFYKEERDVTKEAKTMYRDDLLRFIEQRKAAANAARAERWQEILDDQERFRDKFKAMLGYPLTETRPDTPPEMTETILASQDGITVSRMTFTVMDDIRMTGLLFRREGERPLVIAQHGGLGTPELIAGIYDGTANYNDMLERILPYGVHVFASQLLLWHEDYDVPFNRQEMDVQLKSVGSSITAIEIYGIQRILDWFETKEWVSTFGMIGLSYGGFYTLFTAAADTRIKGALSCSYYCDRNEMKGFPDWRWQNAAWQMQDAEIAALVYPRKLVIGMGDEDPLFAIGDTEREFERLVRLSETVGTDWVSFAKFNGPHEFIKDDRYIEDVIQVL